MSVVKFEKEPLALTVQWYLPMHDMYNAAVITRIALKGRSSLLQL